MYPALESRGDIFKMLDGMTMARKEVLDRCGRLSPDKLNDPVYPGTWSVLKNLAHLAWAGPRNTCARGPRGAPVFGPQGSATRSRLPSYPPSARRSMRLMPPALLF